MKYQIKKGHLDHGLSVWFGGFNISHTPAGETLLIGEIVDQSALYGILMGCRDMGITLISINSGENHDSHCSHPHD